MFETTVKVEGKTYKVISSDLETFIVDGSFTIQQTPKGWTCSKPIDICLLNELGESVMDRVWFEANGI